MIHLTQYTNLGIGTGIGLKIGEITPGAIHFTRLCRQLLGNAALLHLLIGKGGDVAKGAAPTTERTVTIGATEATVQGQFMDFFSVAALQVGTEHIH